MPPRAAQRSWSRLARTSTRRWRARRAETVIQLHGGNYPTQFITSKHFSNTNPVTIESYPGEQAVFTGPTSNPSSSTNAVYLGDVQGLRIRNVTVTAPYSSTGIKIDCGVHVEIDGARSTTRGHRSPPPTAVREC
jgi:hypothetical protein